MRPSTTPRAKPQLSSFIVCKTPSAALSYSNNVYISRDDFATCLDVLAGYPSIAKGADGEFHFPAMIGDFVFDIYGHEGVERGKIGLNGTQRSLGNYNFTSTVSLSPFVGHPEQSLSSLVVELSQLTASSKPIELRALELSATFKSVFANQWFCHGQRILMKQADIQLICRIKQFGFSAFSSSESSGTFGQLISLCDVSWDIAGGSQILLDQTATGSQCNMIFHSDFNFSKMGIGGLDEEFNLIFRRAFASRVFPSNYVKQLGLNHVRGMLLYGPPGCGKTLLARQIAKVLDAKVKSIKGPEILDRYVGGSEEKIRDLFKEAEEDNNSKSGQGKLHVIIFDEIDAICKSRGSVGDNTGVHDSIVNQLLSKIDGMDALNNILVIGMTNRMDLLDEALLRPGRLEIHIEIGLPSEAGRLQIIQIHTRAMRESRRISPIAESRLEELASRAKNFTGAELEGLVKSAGSYAFNRNIDISDGLRIKNADHLRVEWEDFERALGDIIPAFGVKNTELETYFRNGIIDTGPSFCQLKESLMSAVHQVVHSSRTQLLTVLLEGPHGSGKTALSAYIAAQSQFPFVRMITGDALIGLMESSKCQRLLNAFTDSYKSPLSVIVIDDIERIIEYSPAGNRFSNALLQALLLLVRKVPTEPGRKLLIIATTSLPGYVLDQLEIGEAFNLRLQVSELTTQEEVRNVLKNVVSASNLDGATTAATSRMEENNSIADMNDLTSFVSKGIGIKKLLLVVEMAREDDGSIHGDRFRECLRMYGF